MPTSRGHLKLKKKKTLEEDREEEEEEAEALNSHLTGAKGWRTTIETGSFGLIFKMNSISFF